jgi:hypothetical protein
MEEATRKVVTRSPHRTVRLLHYPDLQAAPIECESALERDFVVVASLYPWVRSITHQPFKFKTSQGAYTPDFLIRFDDGTAAVVEVKPREFVDKHAEKIKEAVAQLPGPRMKFFVVDEKFVQKKGVAKQASLIRRYAKARFPEADCQRVLGAVKSGHRTATIGSVTRRTGVPKETILHLLAHRRIACSVHPATGVGATLSHLSHIQDEVSHAIHFGNWLGTTAW